MNLYLFIAKKWIGLEFDPNAILKGKLAVRLYSFTYTHIHDNALDTKMQQIRLHNCVWLSEW